MGQHCSNLTTKVVQRGHWVAQEKPAEVNAALIQWLATSVPDFWPKLWKGRAQKPKQFAHDSDYWFTDNISTTWCRSRG